MVGKLLFFSLLVFYLSACNNEQKPKEPVKIVRNGITISYSSCGDKDTTLLFIHGLCINKEYWQPQEKYFCNRYRVIAIDLPGFGSSGKNRSDWNFDEYADDVKAVIDQLKLKNVVIIGHSMSGDLVLNVANKYPESVIGLVGIDNLHEPGAPMTADQRRSSDSFFVQLSAHFDSTVSRMRNLLFQPTTDPAIVNRVMNDVYTSDSSIVIKVLRSLTDIAQREQVLMKGLPYKLYLVNSDVNPTKLDSLNKYCKMGCELMAVHGTGHYPMIEKPEEFSMALDKVLAGINRNRKD
jgi:pimeloyl-ACP methyl ester carboxylesterase